LVETDFVRYFTRSFLIVAILLLWPAVRWMRIGNARDLGLERNPLRLRDFAVGCVVPIVALWLYGVFLLQFDFYKMKDPLPWHRIPSAIGTALAVSFVEEAFFRGALFGALRRSAPFWIAASVLSALFAVLHFLKPPEGAFAPRDVGWASGFALIPQVFHQFTDPPLVLAGCTTLFLMSLMLCHVTALTRSLWLAIGLHAGLVLGARSFNILAQRRGQELPWVGEDLRIGLLPLAVLLLLWGAMFIYIRHARCTSSGGDAQR
jgi:membrane protease YdiL (CAAX protease family)